MGELKYLSLATEEVDQGLPPVFYSLIEAYVRVGYTLAWHQEGRPNLSE
jgi:hypothetical protein